MASSFLRIALFLLLILPHPLLAQEAAEGGRLVTGVSTNRIAITSNFTGTEIVLFGAVEGIDAPRDYDVVVVIEGPKQDKTVRRKDRFLGIWLNAESFELNNTPSSLYILTSAPLADLATQETVQSAALSLSSRVPREVRNQEENSFRFALMRLKERQGLYGVHVNGVEFLSDVLFRASVSVPASIPVGLHTAEIYLLRDGEVIARNDQPILIEKEGMEETVYTLATQNSLLYGILAVLMAFVLGWLANIVFRKD